MNIGIVGIGKLGSIHLRIYKELAGIKSIYLVDTDKEKLSAHAGIPSGDDYRALAGKVDLVSIATPTATHFEIAKFFLTRRIPVLVEKPITQKLSQARALIEIARTHQTQLMVGHVERYNNAYLAVKEMVRNPRFIECHRLSPYPNRSLDISVVLDVMIHDLDIILDLVRDDISRIDAKGVKILSESADIANVRLTFKGGCVANITASRISAKRERKIRIFLDHCYLSLDYAEQKGEIYQKIDGQIKSQTLDINKEEPLKKEIVDFVTTVKEKSFRLDEAIKAKDALALALRIQKIIDKHP